MKRSEMIQEMINFYNSTPIEASDYHTFDMLLSRMERLGMLPPWIGVGEEDDFGFMDYDIKWESEDE